MARAVILEPRMLFKRRTRRRRLASACVALAAGSLLTAGCGSHSEAYDDGYALCKADAQSFEGWLSAKGDAHGNDLAAEIEKVDEEWWDGYTDCVREWEWTKGPGPGES